MEEGTLRKKCCVCSERYKKLIAYRVNIVLEHDSKNPWICEACRRRNIHLKNVCQCCSGHHALTTPPFHKLIADSFITYLTNLGGAISIFLTNYVRIYSICLCAPIYVVDRRRWPLENKAPSQKSMTRIWYNSIMC